MKQPEIIIIAALGESSRVIGKDGKLPWHIPDDSKRFHDITLGHAVVMGRKTWVCDVEQCPLQERFNIIISSALEAHEMLSGEHEYPFQLALVSSIQEALHQARGYEKVFIAGGAIVYDQALEFADTLELTLVEGEFDGDTFFPEYEHLVDTEFDLVNKELHSGFRFETYKRTVKQKVTA
ncbi:MAG: dihydrofolate reductase [Cyanothece sp. SIO1E1]|nr:dihydrofolate reductase [Cyanothece sp. SIO1E1]